MLGLLHAASKGCVGSVPMQPFLHAGGRDRQTATASLYDLCLKRDVVNAANMDVPLAFGTARGIGVRNAAFRAP